jgi:hypothetical protein
LIVFTLDELGMNSVSLLPSKFRAPPNLPAVQVGPFWSVALFPLPELSLAVVPEPSSRASLTMGPELPLDAAVTVRLRLVVRVTDPAVPVTVTLEVASGVDEDV